jgi:DNA-binding MarR family transcriptional regulator
MAVARKKPSPDAVTAWARLNRVQTALLAAVERDLKAAGFPPLAWYDALLELSRAPDGALRPLDLEAAMLLPQYSTSRLVDRLEKEGLVVRQPCPVDGRGQFVVITPAGRALQRRMWDAYAAAIERHVGTKLSDPDAARLAELLAKLL